MKPIEFKNNKLYLIDQRKLPVEKKWVECSSAESVAKSIKNMIVRGAPAIAVSAAYGIAIGAGKIARESFNAFYSEFKKILDIMADTRPTAINLFWSIDRMNNIVKSNKDLPVEMIKEIILNEAVKIEKEDIKTNKKIGKNGNQLIPEKCSILTHCNAGSLATADFGTALGIIYTAVSSGKKIKVYVDETRPYLQGARLTAFELKEENIDVTLLCDNMAGWLMKQGKIDCIITGADRIALNGDTANKIGTYSLSILAKHHKIPFYIAAPVSTIDFCIKTGNDIPIEQREADEVRKIKGIQVAPDNIDVYNPAFDITPSENITAIITEKNILKKPFQKSIQNLKIDF